jgi:gliding motility-associated lipoprotein GldH
MTRKSISAILVLVLVVLGSCDKSRIYEQNIDLPDTKWEENKELSFDFEVPDHRQMYNVLYNVRYSMDYPFYNLYVKYYLLDSTGKELNQKLQGMDLLDPKTGRPFGKGVGGVYDYRILALPNHIFPYSGKYTMKVKQYMRQNPLPHIYSFGLRVEKAGA